MQETTRKRLTICIYAEEKFVKVSIKDTGPGIDSFIQDTLFKGVIHSSTEGTGVGLLLAHMIFEVYGGDLVVGHTDHTGTEMVGWLPLQRGRSKINVS